MLEYEDVLLRHLAESPFEADDVRELLDFLCRVGHHQEIFYLWRPVLRDPGDDMVLELAVASQAEVIVTFNERHFVGFEAFGVRVMNPGAFLEEIGEMP